MFSGNLQILQNWVMVEENEIPQSMSTRLRDFGRVIGGAEREV